MGAACILNMINHLGIMMDGNRRWAVQHGLEKYLGHREGIKAVDAAVRFALKNGIKHLTLYTLSIENLSRQEVEVSFLLSLLVSESKKRLQEFKDQNIQINFKGDRSLFPEDVVETCDMLEQETSGNDKLKINLLFCYGGQQEIMGAARQLAYQFKNGEISEDKFEDQFQRNLWCSNFPAPELIIRSGGRNRISNYLTFHSAYSEFIFLDALWPDVREAHLQSCLDDYSSRQRNFGK